MDNVNFFLFTYKGVCVTIQKVLSQEYSFLEDLYYFTVSLKESEENITLSIPSSQKSLIKKGTILSSNSTLEIGYCLWKNGLCPFSIANK